MFQEAFAQVLGIFQEVAARGLAADQATDDTFAGELARQLCRIRRDPELRAVVEAWTPFMEPFQKGLRFLQGSGQACPCEECASEREQAAMARALRRPIDRPEMPEAPLELTEQAVQRFAEQVHGWLREGLEDLLGEQLFADYGQRLVPRIGQRYRIGSVSQLAAIANALTLYEKARQGWHRLITEHGHDWYSVEIGCQRAKILLIVVQQLGRCLMPPMDDDEVMLSAMISQAIAELVQQENGE